MNLQPLGDRLIVEVLGAMALIAILRGLRELR